MQKPTVIRTTIPMQDQKPQMSPFGGRLFTTALDAIRDSVLVKPHQHMHVCDCGDFYVCSQPMDKCPVPDPWICLACDIEAQDQWMDEHEQEPR